MDPPVPPLTATLVEIPSYREHTPPDERSAQSSADRHMSTPLSTAEDSRGGRDVTSLLVLPLELVVCVVEESDWKTLCMWRATSRTFFKIVAILLRRRYESYVRRFVPNISAFDELLRANGAIISGTTALHFFLRDPVWYPRQLDIYVPANTFKRFIRTVTESSYFNWTDVPRRDKKLGRDSRGRFARRRYEDLDEMLSGEERMCEERPKPRKRGNRSVAERPDIERVYETGDDSTEEESGPDSDLEDKSETFVQLEHYSPHRPSLVYGKSFRSLRTLRTPLGRRVNVVRSHADNPISPLRSFWTTLTMNFLTPDGCVCPFPSATLTRRGALKLEPLSNRDRDAKTNYEKRGYRFGGSALRRELDTWDYIFFGEQRLLVVDFRRRFELGRPYYPIKSTPRGWLADERWKVIIPYPP